MEDEIEYAAGWCARRVDEKSLPMNLSRAAHTNPPHSRLTIPEFAPTEAHPCRQAHFPPRFAAVGER
jgi:hypothetical protein